VPVAVTEKDAVEPEQTVALAGLAVIEGGALTVTFLLPFELQPLPLVTVTLIVTEAPVPAV
jgi:hypothetical protein